MKTVAQELAEAQFDKVIGTVSPETDTVISVHDILNEEITLVGDGVEDHTEELVEDITLTGFDKEFKS